MTEEIKTFKERFLEKWDVQYMTLFDLADALLNELSEILEEKNVDKTRHHNAQGTDGSPGP